MTRLPLWPLRVALYDLLAGDATVGTYSRDEGQGEPDMPYWRFGPVFGAPAAGKTPGASGAGVIVQFDIYGERGSGAAQSVPEMMDALALALRGATATAGGLSLTGGQARFTGLQDFQLLDEYDEHGAALLHGVLRAAFTTTMG